MDRDHPTSSNGKNNQRPSPPPKPDYLRYYPGFKYPPHIQSQIDEYNRRNSGK